ncbi:hypothetical protein AJ80_05203 [Polytolypa hystricis UAMH7299]|uniref:Major facilitator superfamily (MFS) profile domain-containing protein n=1 Tax=Polytolypa hystricis (strain UAMH7299) TaxID=1447883 RepID=A0A2B7XX47_POLH7|nr:hypothetical protein AJ80_05203 [Polytolypa hystricis UAMH7299]
MFTATWLQTATYLFAVCLFSIAFLVFVNSSVSFVVSDLIDLPDGHGDAVGTLGFADELLALVACPAWGILSDRIGVRYVCTAGYAIISLSLVLLVQAKSLYPGLLLGRLLFSLGGSAASTMVTAVLPSITAHRDSCGSEDDRSTTPELSDPEDRRASVATATHSISSELTITPRIYQRSLSSQSPSIEKPTKVSPSRLAGFVGMLTGCGAVFALLVLLPLPAWFEKRGQSPSQAIKSSYYVVASIAFVVSLVCFVGLRGLPDEQPRPISTERGFARHQRSSGEDSTTLLGGSDSESENSDDLLSQPEAPLPDSNASYFTRSLLLGFTHADIGLAYIGGFVARASSVGVSLFIPLYVNYYYRNSGLCQEGISPTGLTQSTEPDLGDIKKSCPRAYIVASILTGVSQLIALCCAPAFGFLSEKSKRYHAPLLVASLIGILGYLLLALLPITRINVPNGGAPVFFSMAFIGISQIGAIVCSLAVLSSGVLDIKRESSDNTVSIGSSRPTNTIYDASDVRTTSIPSEQSGLLPKSPSTAPANLVHLKGSVAGVYSLYGGLGILILTKLGGLLFDKVAPQSPFYILAGFNAILLLVGSAVGLRRNWRFKST